MSINRHSIKYRQLKAFSIVVETGSFRAAAERLSVAQPSLSALIKELELEVGIPLFLRTTRRCVPTDAGLSFYEDVKISLRRLEDAYGYVKELGQGSRGKLSLVALPSLAAGVVTQALGAFRSKHPAVRIHLTEGKNSEVLRAVRKGDVELGIGSLWEPDQELIFHELYRDRLMFVAPAGHPIAKKRAVFELAERYELILMTAGPTQYALQSSGIQQPPVFEVEHLATAIAMVRSGLGICILPSSAVEVLNTEGLICKEIQDARAVRRLGLIERAGSYPSPTVVGFSALLKEYCAQWASRRL